MKDEPLALDQVATPEEIARRIEASSGVSMSARTVLGKAKRLGLAKKLGRSNFILISDVPKLLEPEPTSRERASARITSGAAALRLLQESRKRR